tara:strand:+ start:311 stop:436 length:126 start_codon:yes stop_codon:yes gene_type:complete
VDHTKHYLKVGVVVMVVIMEQQQQEQPTLVEVEVADIMVQM